MAGQEVHLSPFSTEATSVISLRPRKTGGRWNYMAAPDFNPPNDRCSAASAGCEVLSKSYLIGSKTCVMEDGTCAVSERWKCESGHEWVDTRTRS